MSKKKKLNIWHSWALVGTIILFCLMSCSSLREFAGWNPTSDSRETRNPLSDDEIGNFVTNVRPHQGNPDSHYLMGCYFQERKRHKLAIREFEQVILLDPDHVRAYNRMAVSYDLLRDFPRAVENYKKALNVDPDLDYVHNNLGYSYLLQGNPDSAIKAFQKAIALDGGKDRYHNNLAMAYAEKEQFDLAFKEFKKAGDDSKAYYNLAQVSYGKGNYREAAINLGKGIAASFSKKDKAKSPATDKGLAGTDRHGKPEHVASASPIIISIDRGEQPDMGKESEVLLCSIVPEAGNEMVEQAEEVHGTVVFVPIPKSDNTVNLEEKTDQKEQQTPHEAGVEVLNGNGVNRMARRVGEYLTENGFLVLPPRNADHFSYPETRIYYCIGYLQDAYRVAQHIPGYQNMDKAEQFERSNMKIKVLIGKDLIPFDKIFKKTSRTSPTSLPTLSLLSSRRAERS
ncbi:MAG: tetratricopeptide repeat protein [Deltaproteobacteria bacterium]|nr:MAG: tetratricopeptide repeat protein [Deltaproteobacteria bacterium]